MPDEQVMLWEGRRVEDLSHPELLEAFKHLAEMYQEIVHRPSPRDRARGTMAAMREASDEVGVVPAPERQAHDTFASLMAHRRAFMADLRERTRDR